MFHVFTFWYLELLLLMRMRFLQSDSEVKKRLLFGTLLQSGDGRKGSSTVIFREPLTNNHCRHGLMTEQVYSVLYGAFNNTLEDRRLRNRGFKSD